MSGPIAAALAAGGVRAGDVALHVGRHFSIRDLIVWCKRMQVCCCTLHLHLSDYTLLCVNQEQMHEFTQPLTGSVHNCPGVKTVCADV